MTMRPAKNALLEAIRAGLPGGVIAAIEAGADIEEHDMHGCAGLPLRTACFAGNLAIVRELLKRGANPDAAAQDGPGAPLRLALRRQHHEVAALLLQHGATVPPGVDLAPEMLLKAAASTSVTATVAAPAEKQESSLDIPLEFVSSLPQVAAPIPEPEDTLSFSDISAQLETDATDSFGNATRLISMDILFLDEADTQSTVGSNSPPPTGFWKSSRAPEK